MGWRNPYALGNCCGDGCYSLDRHGCASATHESLANSDLPSYAHGFYSSSQHEMLSELKYSRTEIGYDRGLREMKEAVDGAPIEAYTPRSVVVEDSGSAVPKTGEVIEPIVIKKPNKQIVNEILKAQKEVAGREIILREMEVEEIIIKRRRVRKREIKTRKFHDSFKL